MAAVSPLLVTRDLCRAFGGLRAVDGVDFSLPEGETHAIIGPNGAGKTTFVSLICGRITPTSGSVVFDGREVSRMPAHRRVRAGIAYTFQITSVFANLTAFDNVALAVQRQLIDARAGGRTAHALAEHGMEALDKVGLAGHADKIAGNLSYGHQRLLEVAMGLALKPRLLILDEPTQGLSDGEIDNFIGLVRQIGEEATVLLIEHNMDVVMALAERITVMEQGRILAQGAPAEIRANEAVQQAYLGG
ncbi:ABC transporter ATP-binding protein [Nitratireductor sp. ZSWI3]|uniref:ABC transporter ATP-binding protein n=1 Tax=Nitratireductor sp. ZSWI3 TaxID=2966359 RepID=UPI00214F879D|nr:ABC transporter ATP-binding protein [Nitratireductor sp. ZSWI3]MCR4265483.1 ABC transporter ATP-binding protein [Nitratireductor sp. ZSWI3]